MELARNQPCPECGRFSNRGVSVDVVLFNEAADKVLLVKRGIEPNKGYWATPGGYVLWDESAEQAAAREIAEETGVKFAKPELVGVRSNPERHPQQVINILYLAGIDYPGSPIANDDADEVKWFDVDNLPEPMALDHAQNVQDALAKKRQ